MFVHYIAGTGAGVERRATWRRLLTTKPGVVPPRHKTHHSSTDTDLTTLDTHELWLPDTEPAPSTMSALHQFGAEMLRLSRGLENAIASAATHPAPVVSTVPLVKPTYVSVTIMLIYMTCVDRQ